MKHLYTQVNLDFVRVIMLGVVLTLASQSGIAQNHYYYNFTITGPTTVCAGVTYTYTSSISDPNWAVTDGVVVGGGGASVNVQWPNGFGSISASWEGQDGGECWYEPDIVPPTLLCNPTNYYHYTSNVLGASTGITGFWVSSTNYCIGGSGGNFYLSGSQSGVTYQLMVNGVASGSPVSGTGGQLTWSNLTTTGQYTVMATRSGCSNAIQIGNSAYIFADVASGTLNGSAYSCQTPLSGSLTLTGYNGAIVRWEKKEGSVWVDIPFTGSTYNYTNATITADYRVLISNSCGMNYSTTATVMVSPASAAGFISGAASSYCGSANGSLTLNSYLDYIVYWEFWRLETGSGWEQVDSHSPSFPIGFTENTQVRAVVRSGACAPVTSAPVTLFVYPTPVGGTLASASFCGSASGALPLTGYVGEVQRWEQNNGGGWINIANVGTTFSYSNVAVTTQYRALVGSGTCTPVYSTIATIAVSPVTVGGNIAGGGTFCATASGSLTLNGHVGSVLRWEYFDGNGWLTINNTTSSLSYSGVTTSRQYRAVVKSGSCNEAYSTIATVAIDPVTQGGILAPTDGGRYVYAANASGPLTLSSPHAVVRWEKNTGAGWVAIANTTSAYNYSVSQSTSFRAITKSGVCPVAASTQYDVYLFPAAAISPSATQIIQLGTSFLLSVNSAYFFYQWYKDSNPIPGANSQQYTATEPGNYFVQVRGSATAPFFNSPPTLIKSVVGYYEKTLNAVSQTAVLTEGVAENASLYTLAQNQVIQTISYQDGLGRNFQTIGIGQSPQGGDLISVEAHSKQGLIDSTFLPYATSTRSGLYRPNAIRGNSSHTSYNTSEQYQFYQGTTKVVKDTYPYARTLYANDPTMRVTEQGAPGLDWQPGSTHTVRSVTALNNATYRVRYWKPDGTTNSNYPDNSVMVTIGTDENNNKVRTYTNALGQTVLKQVQMDETLEGVSTPWLETYYIYDQLGRLKYIVPPKAMKVLGTGVSLDAKAASVNELVHIFNYDALGRLVEKKVPSAAWQYIVYDKLDRPVLTQDGNLFATKKWRFVKYDIYNRVVYTGIYTNTTQTTRLAVQGLADASIAFYETEQASATHGYSNVVFPTTGTIANVILSVNYYDHYNFDRDVSNVDDYTYDATHLVGQQATRSFSTRGKVTGSKRVLLNASGAVTTNWITNVVFYDKYDRPIQTQTNNHLHTSWTAATLDKNTVVYDFVKSLKSKTTHFQNATTSVVLDDRNEYDPTGRVLRTYRKINGGAEQLLVQYEYNALGQVVDK
ncbi:MAG: DUF6443 domain-containing protein, partial [Flammeovirgaceae bacterium]|nr:DUF6443 domain-containing protein [Flammeovirgaceae bacterium]